MTYILYNPDGSIKTFMDNIANVSLQEGEMFATSPLSFEEYAAQFELSVKGATCITVFAHVGDPAEEVAISAPGNESVSVDINGEPQLIQLESGRGTLTLPTTAPAEFILTPTDKHTFCPAGAGSICIKIDE